MALITCRECQKQISSDAKSCPGCGAKVIKPKPPKKPILRSIGKWCLIAFAVSVVITVISKHDDVPKTPEQLKQEAADKEERVKITDRNFKAALIADAIRRGSRNPDRVSWETILSNDDASVVCITARMENGFGGLNVEDITAANDKITTSTSSWNKYCASKTFHDVTQAVVELEQKAAKRRVP